MNRKSSVEPPTEDTSKGNIKYGLSPLYHEREVMSSMEEKKIVTAVAVKERAERPEIVVVSDRLSRANQLDTSIKLRAQVINL